MLPSPRDRIRLGGFIAAAALGCSVLCSTSAAAGPAPGVTALLDTSPVAWMTSYGDQIDGDIVRGDGRCLSVWTDLRTGATSGAGHNIYAQIVEDDGSIVFDGSLEVLREPARFLTIPRVTWNGSNYLVAWSDGGGPSGATRATRISPDGVVLDPGGVLVDAGPNFAQHDVASDGTDYLVVSLIATPGGERVVARRIGADGAVVDGTPITVRPIGTPAIMRQLRVTWVGDVYVAVWEEAERIRGARIRPDGQVLDPGGVELTDQVSYWPSIETDGTSCLITWTEFRNFPLTNIGGTVLDPATMTTAGMLPITDSDELGGHGAGELAWSEDRYLVLIDHPEPVFGSSVDLSAVEVGGDGTVLSPVFPVAVTALASQYAKGAAPIPGGFMVTYEDYREGGGLQGIGVYGARIMHGATVQDPDGIPLSLAAPWQTAAAIASDGTQFIGVWEEARGGQVNDWRRDLRVVRFDFDGTPIDGTSTVVAEGPASVSNPQVAGGNGMSLVVWEDRSASPRIRMARVDASGTVLDPGGIVLATASSNADLIRPRVAWAGDRWFVVWHNSFGPTSQVGLIGAVVATDGSLITGPFQVTPQGNGTKFDVAGSPDGFAVSAGYSGFAGTFIRLRRYSLDGVLQGSTTLATQTTNTTRLDFDGSAWSVAWTFGAGIERTIRGARVSTGGAILQAATDIISGNRGVADLVVIGGRIQLLHFDDGGEGLPGGLRLADVDPKTLTVADVRVLDEMVIDELYHGGGLAVHGDHLVAGYPRWTTMPYNACRAHGHFMDMGAPLFGDLNGDGVVGFADLLEMLAQWGACDGCSGDLDGNAFVDFVDLVTLLAAWG